MSFLSTQRELLEHTWAIHRVGAFSSVLDYDSLQSTLPTSMEVQWLKMDSEMASDEHLRRKRDTVISSTGRDGDDDDSGSDNEASYDETQSIKKRRLDQNKISRTACQKQQLCIRVHDQDTCTGIVVFCLPLWGNRSDTEKVQIQSFRFCLARGIKSSYQLVFQWMERMTGNMIPRSPVTLSQTQLLRMVAHGIAEHRNGRPSGQSAVEFKFELPEALRGKGVDSLACSFPLADMVKMCENILGDKGGSGDRDGACSMLQVVREVVETTMKINCKSFLLRQVTWDSAALSSSGQFRPKCGDSLSWSLDEIGTWVSRPCSNDD